MADDLSAAVCGRAGSRAHFTFLGSAAQAPNLNLSLNPNLMNTLFDHEITGCTKEISIKMRTRIERDYPEM